MSQPCGCCAGIHIITPETEVNPPGMPALKYRVGTYASFYKTMLARLSALSIDIPSTDGSGAGQTIYPLKQLTTREPGDPSIALLDAWAVVGDVLTFYQERIANEGYLPTAIERRSILELARLVNYTLRPGVSASVYLAFTVQSGFSGSIPAGTRAQSIPGSGQMPQFYETSADLDVSAAWNNLQPRLTRPQTITVDESTAVSSQTLYLQGLMTNLKIGDTIISTAGGRALSLVSSVIPQAISQRTQVALIPVSAGPALQAHEVARRSIGQASRRFQSSGIASEAAKHLSGLIDQSQPAATVAQKLQQLQIVAAKRNLTRVGAWLSGVQHDLAASIKASPAAAVSPIGTTTELSALGQLDDIVARLAKAPSTQPASSVSLPRKVEQVFAPDSDTAPRLLAAFNPIAATTLYQALASMTTPPDGPAAVYATRVKCGIFANNFSGAVSVTLTVGMRTSPSRDETTTTTFTLPTLADAVRDLIDSKSPPQGLIAVPLDAVYDQIAVGSWVAISRPALSSENSPGPIVSFHQVEGVNTVARETATADGPTGYTAKVSQLTLTPQWLEGMSDFADALESTTLLRNTVIYAQAEGLTLAEEPQDTDLGGKTIELNGLYDGLESGRWVIVSGNRANIPGTTGVPGVELAMIAGVSQPTASPGDTVHTILTLANDLAYTYDLSTVTIYGNVAQATNGQSVGEVLGNGDGSQAFQTFALRQSPLTYLPAATPAGAASTLTVRVNEIEWRETGDISALGPSDHAYTALTNDSAQTTVIFGNGENGSRVSSGTANVKAMYRYGLGSAGNVGAMQISQLATRPLGAQSVINPLPATGGADADTASQARVNTPLAVKALDRLVSIQDYADFSRSYAGIGKAASVKLSNGRRQLVYVTIAGAQDIPIAPTSDLYKNLTAALQQFGDPHLPILIGVRSLKLLVIDAGIEVLPSYEFESVEPKVRAALLAAFSFDRRNLGQTAFLSEAIAAMQGVPGVAFVNVTVFDSVAGDINASELATLGTTLVRRGHVTARAAYVDPTMDASKIAKPTTQDLFQIRPAELAYLTPDIPDTLILTEITSTNPGPPPSLKKVRRVHSRGRK